MTLVVLGAIARLTRVFGPPWHHVLSATAKALTDAFKNDLLTLYRVKIAKPCRPARPGSCPLPYTTVKFWPTASSLFSFRFARTRPEVSLSGFGRALCCSVLDLLARIGSAHTVLKKPKLPMRIRGIRLLALSTILWLYSPCTPDACRLGIWTLGLSR